ncbi:hypothetical protein DEU56DRAFT_761715 [Suillus clintonianus]|uniref:uncharacterized protein n=1 Tax=Suillus clintonianus TaxID=1904413 RepID=UPI001B86F463|nr:uncharacterized protein DEU56DRAFT_761715 [Suillus clintonianus]KAG2115034.1 hypothetical protein DEU56DRAFT_761715 [Suillus clintonianus]
MFALTELALVETKAWWPVAFGIWVSAACGSGFWSRDTVFWADDSKFHALLYYCSLLTIDPTTEQTTGCTPTTFGQIRADNEAEALVEIARGVLVFGARLLIVIICNLFLNPEAQLIGDEHQCGT